MKKVGNPIPRREFLVDSASIAAGGLLAGLSTNTQAEGSAPVQKRPNLLFTFSDQQSYDMLGCYGNEQILTPNLDRFAAEGVRFEHCIASCPICTPYRSMLLTGQHTLYNGCFTNDIQMLHRPGKSFGEVLRDAGYRTGYVGKWHLYGGDRDRPIPPGPNRHGFDDLFVTNNCTVDFRAGHAFYWNEQGEKVIFDEWEALGQTRQALSFLDGCKADEPFALFVSWHPPHDQGLGSLERRYEAPKEYQDRYDPAKIPLRQNAKEYPHIREHYHGYYSMCSGLDDCAGMLLEKLKAKGLDQNTLVVYTSDHGDLLGSHGRPAPKMYPEDESIRVPLILRQPGKLEGGKSSNLLVGTLDLMPTLLSLMGLNGPDDLHGTDLSEAIRSGKEDSIESVPLFYYSGAQPWDKTWFGVYTHGHTYSYEVGRKTDASCLNVLFEHGKDRWQLTNLYGLETQKSVQSHLDTLTRSWLERFGGTEMDGEQLMRLCFGGERAHLYRKGDTGILTGRPIDLMKG